MNGIASLSITEAGSYAIDNYEKYNYIYVVIQGDSANAITMLIPKEMQVVRNPFSLSSTAKKITPVADGYSVCAQGYIYQGQVVFEYLTFTGWTLINVFAYGVK